MHTPAPQTIVVGVDGSPSAQHAVRWAALNAAEADHLVLVHAAASDEPAPFPAVRRGADQTFEAGPYLEALGTWSASAVERRVVEGDPAPTLLAAAREADLLVLGRSRRARSSWPTAGSLTRRVLAGAACPVVIVPEPTEGVS